jgi:hypothetical protein
MCASKSEDLVAEKNTPKIDSSRYVVTELKDPPHPSAEFKALYEKFSKRILWMDGDVVPGAFQMNTAWYYAVPERNPVFEEHSHECDELIGFIGSNPDDPYNLNAEIEVWVDGDRYLLTTSTLIFVPANLKHMPLKINRVDKPIFHFSVVTNSHYDEGAYKA